MKYKTETLIEAIRLKEAGVTTSAISKKLLAPTSTINEWLKKAKQNNLTGENLRTLSEHTPAAQLVSSKLRLARLRESFCKGLGSENDGTERLLAISGFCS